MNSHTALFTITSDCPLPDRIIEDPFVSVNPKFGGFAITLTPIPSTPAYRPLVEGEVMQEGDVFYQGDPFRLTTIDKGWLGQKWNCRVFVPIFRPILTPSPIKLEEAEDAKAHGHHVWYSARTRNYADSGHLDGFNGGWTAALRWAQGRAAVEPPVKPSAKIIYEQAIENAALREALSECQKDVARHESGKNAAVREAGRRESDALKALRHVTPCNMCNGMAQALLAKAALSGAHALASTPEPPAKEQCGYYKCNRCGATEPRYGNAQHLGAHDCGTLSQIHHGQWIWHEEPAAVPAGAEKLVPLHAYGLQGEPVFMPPKEQPSPPAPTGPAIPAMVPSQYFLCENCAKPATHTATHDEGGHGYVCQECLRSQWNQFRNIKVIPVIIPIPPAPEPKPGAGEPDYSDGHDWEGFPGGCKRFGCPDNCQPPKKPDVREAAEKWWRAHGCSHEQSRFGAALTAFLAGAAWQKGGVAAGKEEV